LNAATDVGDDMPGGKVSDEASGSAGDATSGLYYDPFNVEIDNDPYPVWERLRNEAPLYRNHAEDLYALSRWDDVERALIDWETYRSGKGTIFEIIKAVTTSDVEIPAGIILFEDPPIHDLHRGLLSRVFTPRRMAAIEPLVRGFCAKALDPLVGADEIDVIADFSQFVPMRHDRVPPGHPRGGARGDPQAHRRPPGARGRQAAGSR